MTLNELDELICYASGMSETETDLFINDGEEIEDLCYEKFNCDAITFAKIAVSLLEFTPQIKTAISGTTVNAFIRVDGLGAVAIVQQEVNTTKKGK